MKTFRNMFLTLSAITLSTTVMAAHGVGQAKKFQILQAASNLQLQSRTLAQDARLIVGPQEVSRNAAMVAQSTQLVKQAVRNAGMPLVRMAFQTTAQQMTRFRIAAVRARHLFQRPRLSNDLMRMNAAFFRLRLAVQY